MTLVLGISRGIALKKLGQYEALASFDKAVQIQPEDQSLAQQVLPSEKWNFTRTRSPSFDKALQLKPDYHEAWVDRGVLGFAAARGSFHFIRQQSNQQMTTACWIEALPWSDTLTLDAPLTFTSSPIFPKPGTNACTRPAWSRSRSDRQLIKL